MRARARCGVGCSAALVGGEGMAIETLRRDQLYGRRWRKARKAYLLRHPRCVMCAHHGKLTRATVVDHIRPHRGGVALFWDHDNWQPLCEPHHNITKQRFEKSNKATGVDSNGRPIDPHHPWNKAKGGGS